MAIIHIIIIFNIFWSDSEHKSDMILQRGIYKKSDKKSQQFSRGARLITPTAAQLCVTVGNGLN